MDFAGMEENDDLDVLTSLMDDDAAFENQACELLEQSPKEHEPSFTEMAEEMSQMKDYIKQLESQLANKEGTSKSRILNTDSGSDVSAQESESQEINAVHSGKQAEHVLSSISERKKEDSKTIFNSQKEKLPSKSPTRKQGITMAALGEENSSVKERQGNVSTRTSIQMSQGSLPPLGDMESSLNKHPRSSENIGFTKKDKTSTRRFKDARTSTPSKENKRLAHNPTCSATNESEVPSAHAQKRKAEEDLGPRNKKFTEDDGNILSDKFSGFRIINPLVSSAVMGMRMEGRKFVKTSQILSRVKGTDIEGDWVTIAVLAHKLPARKSSNGKTYGIWKLSDLGSTTANDFVGLFLFGDVYKEHWKTAEGTVVALLNSSILPAKDKYSQDLALSIDNPKKLMVMGISKDFGRCKGIKKKDGKPCSNIVNREYGEYCEYHVQTAYKKMRSQRMECQSGYGAPSKAPLMDKFKKDLNSATFMYQGKTLFTQPVSTQKKNNVTLKSFQGLKGSKEVIDAARKEAREKREQEKSSEHMLVLMELPTIGTRNLMKHLEVDDEKMKPKEEKVSISASELLKVHRKTLAEAKSRSSRTSSQRATNLSHVENKEQTLRDRTPTLGRGFTPGSDILFNEGPKRSTVKGPDKASLAKLRAIALVRQQGPLEKEDPNATSRKKVSPKAQESSEDESPTNQRKNKRRKLLGEEFGSIDFNSEEGRKLLKRKSAHVGAVRAAEAEMEGKYFSELENKERLEDKMKTIKEIKVKVVCCSQCDYIAESASDLCHKEKHKLKYTTAMKKFFACKECKQRTVIYRGPVPRHSCSNCGSRNYEKASLYKEKQGPKIGGETLLVRGQEHAKFRNSLE